MMFDNPKTRRRRKPLEVRDTTLLKRYKQDLSEQESVPVERTPN